FRRRGPRGPLGPPFQDGTLRPRNRSVNVGIGDGDCASRGALILNAPHRLPGAFRTRHNRRVRLNERFNDAGAAPWPTSSSLTPTPTPRAWRRSPPASPPPA